MCPPLLRKAIKMSVFLTREQSEARAQLPGRHRAPISDVTFPSAPHNLPHPPPPRSPAPRPASCRDHRRRVISPDLVFPSRKDRTCSPSLPSSISQSRPVERVDPLRGRTERTERRRRKRRAGVAPGVAERKKEGERERSRRGTASFCTTRI